MNFLSQKRKGTRLKMDDKMPAKKSQFNDFYYREVAKLTAAGGYGVNIKKKESYLDPEARRILNVPENFKASLKNALDFYAPEHKGKATEYFMKCTMGEPFNITIKMLTYDGKEFWARAIGKPWYDEDNEIIGMNGVFQDINAEKMKEISLEKSVKIIGSQNSRLFNFAHIVSHNLRSHASNLQLTLELMKSIDNPEEETELKQNLHRISDSLNTTISHLNEIVSVQSKAHEEKKIVNFENTLQTVKHSINRIILDTNTEIFSDFSEVPEIRYIPAYMESILLNLITNAIKYRHPDRDAVIDIYSYLEDGKVCLAVKDNGLGIDLETYGEAVFQMYKTFHHNGEDSVGIGLFITKNQIESLQGVINVESTVDQGSTFMIKF